MTWSASRRSGHPLTIDDESVRATLAAAVSTPRHRLDHHDHAQPGDGRRRGRQVTAGQRRDRAEQSHRRTAAERGGGGLWTFNGVEGKSAVPLGPVSDQSAALTNTLGGLSPSGSGAVSFTTLRLAYGEALANFRQGQTNSLLVITQGPHTDQTLDGPGLIQYVKSAADPAKPVAINVIDFGDDSDRATWEAVAQASGGTYQKRRDVRFAGPRDGNLDAAVLNFLRERNARSFACDNDGMSKKNCSNSAECGRIVGNPPAAIARWPRPISAAMSVVGT